MFVHLHCHSHYSFLRGASAPGDYVRAAAACGMPAVALTDTNGLYAAIAFYREAVAAGVKPILGVELDYEGPTSNVQGPRSENSNQRSAVSYQPSATHNPKPTIHNPPNFAIRNPQSAIGNCPLPQAPARACGAHDQSESLVLLALSRAGYANLCRLVSIRQVRERPVTVEELARHGADVAALSHALAPLPALEEIYGDRLYIEARAPDGSRALRAALEASRALGIPVAATNAVHFCAPEDHLTHRVLTAIREGSLLSKLPPEITAPPDAWFRPPEAMAAAFAAAPQAVRSTLEIAERSNVRFDFGQLIFPHFDLPEGESAFSLLWKLCFEGAAERYRPLTPRVIARLQQELEAIEKLNLAPYFLIVWDIVRHAASQGIPTVGRGSAASSIVAYCLGITSICPLRYGLYFERFLNEQRRDVPDIDLDICGRRRDEVLDYVYKKYGEERVAMIASFVTMQARMAVREVGKVFGMNPQELNHFCRRLPHRPVHELRQMLRALPECRGLPVEEEPYRTVLDVALRLDQAPRHLGIHPCGTVISHAPLTELAPLELATKGIVVTQYDMHSIEALGLIKMDLLGQRALTTFTDTLNALRARGVEVDFWHLPEDEPVARRLIRSGQTMGVFQVESPGMRGLLRATAADTIEQVCLALALIRPGASEYGSKETFLRRHRGEEPVRYLHPALEPILKESLGVCIYQEQVLRIAEAMAGFSWVEADLLRRLMTHQRSAVEMERFRGEFVRACAARGIPPATVEQIWQSLEKFAGFGFCKAHAATYADLAWRICCLKAHYPAEFMAAVCSSGAGFYHPAAYVEEARRMKLRVLPPCVNHSEVAYTAEQGALRIGLMQVKNLTARAMESLLEARRAGGPFRSLEDFLRRVEADRSEVESLIKCGAFDCFKAMDPRITRISRTLECGSLLPLVGARLAPPERGAASSAPTETQAAAACRGGPPRPPDGEARVLASGAGIPACPALDEIPEGDQDNSRGQVPMESGRRPRLAEENNATLKGSEKPGAMRPLQGRNNPTDGTGGGAPGYCLAPFQGCDTTQPAGGASIVACSEGQVGTRHGSGCPAPLEAETPACANPALARARPTRPELLWLLDRIYDRVARQKQERTGRLFPAPGAGAGGAGAAGALEASEEWARVPRLRDYGPEQKLDIEQEVLEVFASGHPLDFVRRNGELPARRIPEFVHRTVTCLGWLITYRRVGTKDLRNMMFLTFEDKTAVFEAVLFPDAYEKFGGLIFDARLFRVTGRVERDGQINCSHLETIR